MKKTFTCILCPNSCILEAEAVSGEEPSVRGYSCARGRAYAIQEMTHPVRTFSSSVLVRHGISPLVSVRTDRPVPREKIMKIMEEIRVCTVDAPIRSGDILLRQPAETDCNIIATRDVGRLPES